MSAPAEVVEWLGLRLELPRRWEVIRHGISGRKGSLALADRRRQRLQVTWTSCVKRPDVGRLLSDHRDRQKTIDADAAFVKPTLPVGWRGLERRFAPPADSKSQNAQDETAILVRAARYDKPTDRLIEVVLDVDPHDPADAALAEQVLGGLRVVGKAEDAQRLQAFGINADLSEGWRLHRTAVQPADVTLVFVPQKARRPAEPHHPLPRSVTLRRRALTDVWFRGDWRTLFQHDEPKADIAVADPAEPEEVPGHPAATATWDVPGPRYQKIIRRHQVATSLAWLCPREKAIYQMTAVGPAKDPAKLAGFMLACGGAAEERCDYG